MQALYALRAETENTAPAKPSDPLRLLNQHFNQTFSLFTWMLYVLTETARYAEKDTHQKASKHRPTTEDLNVPIKIAGNEALWKMLESSFYKQALQQYKQLPEENAELVKSIYLKLFESQPYALYNAQPERDKRTEREIMDFIFTDLMLANEDFTDAAETLYTNWDDDADMLRMLLLQFIQKPSGFSLDEMLNKEKRDFANQLIKITLERHEQFQELIKPKLRNWDADRIALLDMILLEMGICEFLYFDTIPPKVTINEYIDLAKAYSTQQSGHFINGMLDNVRKDLEAGGQLQNKTSFKRM